MRSASIVHNLSKHASSKSRLALQPHLHFQVRNLPWVPLAYRRGARLAGGNSVKTRPSPKAKARTTPRSRALLSRRKKMGANSAHPSRQGGHNRQRHESFAFSIQSHKENLLKMQEELDLSIIRYQQSLAAFNSKEESGTDNDPQPKASNERSRQITTLLTKLSALHKGHSPDSWKQAEETEEQFRKVGTTVSDMINLTAKIQNLVLDEMVAQNSDKHDEHILYFYCSLAEQLLSTLIQIQSDRLQFVTTAMERDPNIDSNSSGSKVSWFGWLKNSIMGSSTTSSESNEEHRILAHEDPLCSPRLEHFQALSQIVLRTIKQESKDSGQSSSSFRIIKRAQRLQHVLEKTPPNVEPDSNTISALMSAYALVGSYESARACERVFEKYPEKNDDLFGEVLYAYFTAARSSSRSKDRSKAALRADELVREKWMEEGGPNEYKEKKFVHCTKAMLCLNAVGANSIPDVHVRADTLVNMCVGRENLEEVFRNGNLEGLWKVAPSTLTLPLLNCLVLIYASSRDPSRVNLAKRLLQIMLEDTEVKESTKVSFPDVRTCKAVLAGLVGINDRRTKWTRVATRENEQTKTAKNLEDSSHSCLEYGLVLLDHMFTRSQCWPDQPYFHSLLRLLLMSKPQNTGEIADTLLSKMHVRECFGRLAGHRTIVTRKTYHYVLRAWLASAEAGNPQAAQRALELVELMEAQSIPLLSSSDSPDSVGSSVYRTDTLPDRSTYQLLLKICGSIKVESEKEDAMDIALLVDKKMKKRCIQPTSDTYSLLFACCNNLLPENSKRRQNVTQQLLEDAREAGDGKPDDREKNTRESGGGGLLSDLV